MKTLLETTSNIMLIDPNTGDLIDETVPTLTEWTAFLEQRAGLGQIRVLHRGFQPEASNDEWLDYLKASDGKVDLAMDSFISVFGIVEAQGTKKAAVVLEQKLDGEINPSKPPRAKKG